MSQTNGLTLVENSIRELNIPGIAQKEIATKSRLREDLGIDSLNLLILLVKIQEVSDFDLTGLQNGTADINKVEDLVSLVNV